MTFDGWPSWYCPYMDEVQGNSKKKREKKRPVADLQPCTSRYRPGCGCKKDGKPSPFRHYTRSTT